MHEFRRGLGILVTEEFREGRDRLTIQERRRGVAGAECHAAEHRQAQPRLAPSIKNGRASLGQGDLSFALQGTSTHHTGEAHQVWARRRRQADRA